MVAKRLVEGLSYQEHQRNLAEASALVTLSDKVNRLHMLETTEESVTMLHKVSFHRSSYKREKSG